MLQEQAVNIVSESSGPVTSLMADEFLTFRLGDEEYRIEILKVQETCGYDCITQIANVPEFIKGIVNLHGVIVPVIDMRIKFRPGTADNDQLTVVIFLNVAGRGMGIVVDGVSDVLTLEAEQMRPIPEFGSFINTEYIMGLGTVEEQKLILRS